MHRALVWGVAVMYGTWALRHGGTSERARCRHATPHTERGRTTVRDASGTRPRGRDQGAIEHWCLAAGHHQTACHALHVEPGEADRRANGCGVVRSASPRRQPWPEQRRRTRSRSWALAQCRHAPAVRVVAQPRPGPWSRLSAVTRGCGDGRLGGRGGRGDGTPAHSVPGTPAGRGSHRRWPHSAGPPAGTRSGRTSPPCAAARRAARQRPPRRGRAPHGGVGARFSDRKAVHIVSWLMPPCWDMALCTARSRWPCTVHGAPLPVGSRCELRALRAAVPVQDGGEQREVTAGTVRAGRDVPRDEVAVLVHLVRGVRHRRAGIHFALPA